MSGLWLRLVEANPVTAHTPLVTTDLVFDESTQCHGTWEKLGGSVTFKGLQRSTKRELKRIIFGAPVPDAFLESGLGVRNGRFNS